MALLVDCFAIACQAMDGRFPRVFKTLTKTPLLILDDWGPERLDASQRHDLMEIVEDRYEVGSTLPLGDVNITCGQRITSQLPIDTWHDVIGEPTFAPSRRMRCNHLPGNGRHSRPSRSQRLPRRTRRTEHAQNQT